MWKRTTGMLLALALGLGMLGAPAPARAASFGDDSDGAVIAAGLAIAVVAVYGLVALRSDAERFAEAPGAVDAGAWERAAAAAEESPVVLQAIESHDRLQLGEARPDGLALGVRLRF